MTVPRGGEVPAGTADPRPRAAMQQPASAWPGRRYAWYVALILTLAYAIAFVDRMVLGLLVGPIKADLGVSDTVMGLLHGFAFALFYTLVGLPVARLADVMNRKLIIASGIFLWSLMTAACGLAKNVLTLFTVRAGVAVGEAFLGPSAYSILSDYFPPKRLTKAIGFYQMGQHFGIGLALVGGGAVLGWASAVDLPELPLIGLLKPWQVTFIMVGLPGLVVGALMFTVREPLRRGLIKPAQAAGRGLSVAFVARFVARRWKIYLTIIAAHALLAMVVIGVMAWMPEFLARTYGVPHARVGHVLGILMMIFGPLGLLAGSRAVSWFRERGHEDANLRAALLGTAFIAPPAALAPLMPSFELALAVASATVFFSAFPVAAEIGALQMVTPNQMRAQISALFMLTINIIGAGFGPVLIGATTDYVFADEADLRYSLAAVTALAALGSTWMLALGLRHFRDGLAEAAAWSDSAAVDPL